MLTKPCKDTQSKSYSLDTQEEMRTQSDHDKGEQLVPTTVGHIKAIDVDKAQQRNSIEILRAGYMRTQSDHDKGMVSTKDSQAAIDVHKAH